MQEIKFSRMYSVVAPVLLLYFNINESIFWNIADIFQLICDADFTHDGSFARDDVVDGKYTCTFATFNSSTNVDTRRRRQQKQPSECACQVSVLLALTYYSSSPSLRRPHTV